VAEKPAAPVTATEHKNDMYGNVESRAESDPGVSKPIAAATVVLLRDSTAGMEVLMLRKNSKITFGGMWVFPGGKIDPQDYPTGSAEADHDAAARQAAVRETQEEAGLELDAQHFVWFAHWTPPPGPQKRFATWFFAAQTQGDQAIKIDDGEIKEHAWLNPADALQRHAAGEIDLVPPTWVTLHYLSCYPNASAMLQRMAEEPAKVYATRVVKAQDGDRVAMWEGDAGYEPWVPDTVGSRHRLVMAEGGFHFQNDVETY
jgi:8-oxo-dGTP pyrophosphatase MutT (NUDIX family)